MFGYKVFNSLSININETIHKEVKMKLN